MLSSSQRWMWGKERGLTKRLEIEPRVRNTPFPFLPVISYNKSQVFPSHGKFALIFSILGFVSFPLCLLFNRFSAKIKEWKEMY